MLKASITLIGCGVFWGKTVPGMGLRGLLGSTADSMVMTPSRSGPQPSWLWAFTLNRYEWLGSRSCTCSMDTRICRNVTHGHSLDKP